MTKGKCEDIAVYEELRSTLRQEDLVLYDTVSLGVFTEAYRALKKALHDESMNVTAANADEFADRAMYLHDALKDYERLLFTLDSGIQPNISKFVDLENDDVLDNAFSNFLKTNLTFTQKELMAYFDERYSEKTLLKYVGNVPIYKKRMLFDKKDIESRLEGLIGDGVVLDMRASELKGKKGGKEKFISMPAVYAVFTGPWNPLVVYPEVEYIAAESSRVLRELMIMEEAETNQAGKMLKMLFKGGGADGFIQNFTNIMLMYYEQMNEPKPDFIIEASDGPTIALTFPNSAFYESVTV